MSGTAASWTPERRAAQSAFMTARNRDPAFIAARPRGTVKWTPEQRAAKAVQMRAMNADPAFQKKRLAGISKRLPRPFALPKHVHPIVRGLFVEMNEQRTTQLRVAQSAGLLDCTLSGWRKSNMPLLDTIEAALNTLGLELAIVPAGSRDQNGFVRKKTRNANDRS
jgi:hypothetical protein